MSNVKKEGFTKVKGKIYRFINEKKKKNNVAITHISSYRNWNVMEV